MYIALLGNRPLAFLLQHLIEVESFDLQISNTLENFNVETTDCQLNIQLRIEITKPM